MTQQQTKRSGSPAAPQHELEPGQPDDPGAPRRRDAARTRDALLDAARRRFARDGYAATTVRDIAHDAGVNVALISRYFESKAGLFEACLMAASQAMSQSAGAVSTLAEAAEAIGRQSTGTGPDGGPPEALLMFLRSSGDEHAEQSRVRVLRTFAERLATLAGWTPGGPDENAILLRAELVLAAAMGIGVLRAVGAPEPLMSASEAELSSPLHDLVNGLLAAAAD
jgi:AcrR family transcriptional regulator